MRYIIRWFRELATVFFIVFLIFLFAIWIALQLITLGLSDIQSPFAGEWSCDMVEWISGNKNHWYIS